MLDAGLAASTAGSCCRSCAGPARKRTRLLIVLSLDTQQSRPMVFATQCGRTCNAGAQITELMRVLGSAGELARVLVVESNEVLARAAGRSFLMGEDRAFASPTQPRRPPKNAIPCSRICCSWMWICRFFWLNLVAWLREQESLTRTVLVLYSGRAFSSTENGKSIPEPTAFLKRARVQPQQLEALLLTMLRGNQQMEVAEEMSDVRGS